VLDIAGSATEVQAPDGWRRWLARGRGRWLGVLAGSVFAGALLLTPDPGPVPALRFGVFDTYQWLLPRTRISSPAVIVAVDDSSLVQFGQWPWPRDLVARLITLIAARNPTAIGIDIVFAEPDRVSPERIADALRARDPAIAERLLKLRPNDEILAEAIAQAPVVLGVAGMPVPTFVQPPGVTARMVGPLPPLPRYPGALYSLPQISRAANGHGLLNAAPERGVVRRVPLVAAVGDYPLLTLALECLRIAARAPLFTLLSNSAGLQHVEIGDLRVPVQTNGSLWVHYTGPDAARYVSAADVLKGRDDPALTEGKIALLGVTGLGLVDQQTTSRGDRMPGIEIHAQVLENIFDGALLSRPGWAHAAEALLFGLAAAIIVYGLPRVRPRRSVLILFACWGTLAAVAIASYLWGRILLDAATPIAAINVVYGVMISATLVAIDLQRRDLSARLAVERIAAARISGELETASQLQTGMLPIARRVLGDERRAEIFAHMRPAREVGGDLYDFFLLPDDRLFVLAGDVSGKGLPAAMFMVVSKALAKSSALRARADLGTLMMTLNTEISRDNPAELFVTLLALVIDLRTGQLEYCNAGHEPLLLVRRGEPILTPDDGGGPPLCALEEFAYEPARLTLQPNDILVLTSDGITEAMNRDAALYGRDRLKLQLAASVHSASDITVIGNEVLKDVATFEAGAEPADDQTLLLVAWRGAAAAKF